jgi:AraC-like DNA-binding protein
MHLETLTRERPVSAAMNRQPSNILPDLLGTLECGNTATTDPSQRALAHAVIALLERAGGAKNHEDAKSYITKAVHMTRSWMENDPVISVIPLRGGLAPWQLNQAKNFIEKNLGRTIKIKDLAMQAGLGSSYFFQAFRSSVGVSPHTYIVQRRIECAQRLILLTHKPLSEIALECGLADQPHLTRLFRSIVGSSPGAWRRTHVCSRTRLEESEMSSAYA